MMVYEVLKKFLKLSASSERIALDIYERLPLSMRYGPAYLRWLTFLQKSDKWDKDRVYAYQLEQTRNLLVHSMKHVPYYKKLFSNLGFRPEKIQRLDDLSELPYLGKEDVRNNPLAFVDERISLMSLVKSSTGGSSGIPMTVYKRKESIIVALAFRANILSRIGHAPKVREVMIWYDVELGNKSVPFARYGNRLLISMKYLTYKWIFKYLDMIRKFEPKYILGFPSALALLATVIKHHDLSPYQNVKAVIPYSETLYNWQRELMEESFSCRVFSKFGMNEFSAIGGECENSSSLHFHPLYGLIEFVDTIQGYKEIVATGFNNYAMPFIRYKTGDLVSEYGESCQKCGRHHKIVGTIEGRSHEFLVGKNDELMSIRPVWITSFTNVLQCQFFQEEPGIVYLKIVPTKAFSKTDKSHIIEKLYEMLGTTKDAIDIELVVVDHVQMSSSGKINMIEQKLDIHSLPL